MDNILGYATSVASDFGLSLSEDDNKIIEQYTTQEQVNQYLMEQLRRKPAVNNELTPELLATLSQVRSKDNFETIKRLESEAKKCIEQAASIHRQMQTYLHKAYEMNEEADLLLSKPAGDMTEYTRQVVADGWFQLHSIEHDIYGRHVLCFITPPVVMSDDRPTVQQSVLMGQYLVKYTPLNARLIVQKYRDNLTFNGYMHPHLNSSGEVCWGNAHDMVANVLSRGGAIPIKPMFDALRVILCTYNSDSPYARFSGFKDARARQTGTPSATDGQETRVILECPSSGDLFLRLSDRSSFEADDTDWCSDSDDINTDDYIDTDYIDAEYDEDGDEVESERTIYKVVAYARWNSSTQSAFAGTIYTRDSDGIFKCIN